MNILNGWLIYKNHPLKINCLQNILKFKNPLLCIKFCTKQMIKKNSKLVDIFNSGLKDLEEEIKKMSKKERENE